MHSVWRAGVAAGYAELQEQVGRFHEDHQGIPTRRGEATTRSGAISLILSSLSSDHACHSAHLQYM